MPDEKGSALRTLTDIASNDLVIGVDTSAGESINYEIDTLYEYVKVNDNLLINGCFRVAQDGTAFDSTTTPANSDDTYLFDQWVLLSDGNDIVDVSQETTTVPTGSYAAIKFDVEIGNKKFGIFQPLESIDCVEIIGGVASLSFKARVSASATIGNLRAAIISWDSTADTITSDIVSVWEVAGTNPTLVSNWTYENTPASLDTLTETYQTFKIENISIDTADTKNVGVFIWSDDITTTVGDLLYVADIKLEKGSLATEFNNRNITDEIIRCKRFFTKFIGESSATVWDTDCVGIANVLSTTDARGFIPIGVPIRIKPAITFVAVALLKGTTSYNVSSAGVTGEDFQSMIYVNFVSTGMTLGDQCMIQYQTSGGNIRISARL